MKRKTLLSILIAFIVLTTFSSCKEEVPPMLGYWKCTGIGANVLGTSTSTIGEDMLKYFSISYAGVGTSGVYARVGADDLNAVASLATSTGISAWKEFLTTGKYTYDATAGTITHTSKGESKTYKYSISNNGKTLKLVEANDNVGSSSALNSALDILNNLLGTDANTTVGVEYTYEKLSGEDAFNALKL
ncbi:hypothetical protein LJC68_01195 [Bacteroidales bacterium OttesenSCG-928-B11]|nr:hypothetical protein [Bacteroidales bacterium OttesenSCG-928-E04]MDL2308166.1 hypothetical protein [Bacteroidales bacterium OttesenSCG-928-C03]MDL2311479.1 hypothetical protein [Bacteroidales bacterium OttesenSCG-928-B11]MDL2325592.1 hypothetical protein [Bacteroidales bacterium OttesenSCG-928-A14]